MSDKLTRSSPEYLRGIDEPEAASLIEALQSKSLGDASEIEHLKGSIEVLRRERDALEADNKEILREWKEAARTHNSSMDSMYKALAAMTAERDELLGTVKRLTVEMRDWQQGDSLRQAKARVLREAAGRMSIASDYAILFRMADELEQGK